MFLEPPQKSFLKKKKDQLALVQSRINICARPDPDDPGGLGAEESETERTGPTQGSFVAIHDGEHWAEVGQYYDSANEPVTWLLGPKWRLADLPPRGNFSPPAKGLLQRRAVGAIMALRLQEMGHEFDVGGY